jgi:hypothetical protein
MKNADLAAQVEAIWERLGRVEVQVAALEGLLRTEVDGLSEFKRRSKEEIATLRHELSQVVNVLELVVSSAESRADAQRAEDLLRRARRHLARANRDAA